MTVTDVTSRAGADAASTPASAVAVAFLAAGCGAVAHMTAPTATPRAGKALFKTQLRLRATRWPAPGTTGMIGPNLDTTFGIVTRPGLRRVDDPRRRARTDRLSGDQERRGRAPGCRPNLVTGQDAEGRRRLRRRVRAASGAGRGGHRLRRPDAARRLRLTHGAAPRGADDGRAA